MSIASFPLRPAVEPPESRELGFSNERTEIGLPSEPSFPSFPESLPPKREPSRPEVEPLLVESLRLKRLPSIERPSTSSEELRDDVLGDEVEFPLPPNLPLEPVDGMRLEPLDPESLRLLPPPSEPLLERPSPESSFEREPPPLDPVERLPDEPPLDLLPPEPVLPPNVEPPDERPPPLPEYEPELPPPEERPPELDVPPLPPDDRPLPPPPPE